jgi:hypothetical protein
MCYVYVYVVAKQKLFKMVKILVTGANGYIGNGVARALRAAGHTVYGSVYIYYTILYCTYHIISHYIYTNRFVMRVVALNY